MTTNSTLRQMRPTPSSGRLPAVQAGQALLSLRDSGHDLPTALGEVLDNSVEAQAGHIKVVMYKRMPKPRPRSMSIASRYLMMESVWTAPHYGTTPWSAIRPAT